MSDLPDAVLCRVLDRLPERQRLAARLVCRAWALAPLRVARGHGHEGAWRVLACIRKYYDEDAATKHWSPRRQPLLRFEALDELEIATTCAGAWDCLPEVLTSKPCEKLEALTLGPIRHGMRAKPQEVVALCAGMPSLRRLTLGSHRYNMRWTEGGVVLRHGFQRLQRLECETSAAPRGPTLGETIATHVRRIRPSLVIATALPGLQLLALESLGSTAVVLTEETHLRPETVVRVRNTFREVQGVTCIALGRGGEFRLAALLGPRTAAEASPVHCISVRDLYASWDQCPGITPYFRMVLDEMLKL